MACPVGSADPYSEVTALPELPRLTDLRRSAVFADAKQTMWRLERPFVLPAGSAFVPTVTAVPAATRMSFDAVQARRHETPGMVPG
jgi:hypothetical protein